MVAAIFALPFVYALICLITGEITVVLQRAHNTQYSPSGHLIFTRNEQLFAIPFDIDTLQTTGPETLISEDVSCSNSYLPFYDTTN